MLQVILLVSMWRWIAVYYCVLRNISSGCCCSWSYTLDDAVPRAEGCPCEREWSFNTDCVEWRWSKLAAAGWLAQETEISHGNGRTWTSHQSYLLTHTGSSLRRGLEWTLDVSDPLKTILELNAEPVNCLVVVVVVGGRVELMLYSKC